MGRVDGKVAIVTGGASGMGKADAQLLAAEGARVVVADLNEADGQAVAAAMLGGRVMMMSKVGDDMITDRLWRLSAIRQLCLSLRCAGLAPVP